MVYATNVAGDPIYGTFAHGIHPRLLRVNGENQLADGTVVLELDDGTGNPMDAGNNPIVQPSHAFILNVKEQDRFGRTPGTVNTEVAIDYSTKEGMNSYKEATRSVYRDSEKCFGLTSEALYSFSGKMNHRAQLSGWPAILDIVVIPATAIAPAVTKNLLMHYGEITIEQVQAAVAGFDGTSTIQVQYDEQLYSCIMNSLSIHAINLVGLKIQDFQTATHKNSGLLLLYLVNQESTLQTKSTENALWGRLTAQLPAIMTAHANNIMTFNTEVRETQRALRSRGKDPSNIIPQLFAVYQGCEGEDTAFFRFIEYMENEYNGGLAMDAEHLMFKAEEKYKELKERQKYTTGKGKPSDLVALQTKFDDLARQVKNQKVPGGDGKKGKGSGYDDSKDQWMLKKPSGGEPSTKMVNEKAYHWCDGNGAHKPKWVRHLPSECRGKARDTKPDGESKKTEQPSGDSGAGGWTAAMQALIDEE